GRWWRGCGCERLERRVGSSRDAGGIPDHTGRCFLSVRRPPRSTRFPYTTLFRSARMPAAARAAVTRSAVGGWAGSRSRSATAERSEEHTSELQSPYDLVCRRLLEKKNNRAAWPATTTPQTRVPIRAVAAPRPTVS